VWASLKRAGDYGGGNGGIATGKQTASKKKKGRKFHPNGRSAGNARSSPTDKKKTGVALERGGSKSKQDSKEGGALVRI